MSLEQLGGWLQSAARLRNPGPGRFGRRHRKGAASEEAEVRTTRSVSLRRPRPTPTDEAKNE